MPSLALSTSLRTTPLRSGLAAYSPSLLLDFTSGNQTLDSRITFTRASTATRTNASGIIESVATNTARFDYNPVTLAPLGLLIEESRTNLLTYSEELDTGWTNGSAATWQVSSGVSPAGTTTALGVDGLSGTAVLSSGGALYKTAITISGSTAYTFSVYVRTKTGTATNVRLRFNETGGNSTTSSDFTVTTAWTRISLSVTTAAGATATAVLVGTGVGTANLYIWGAQLEAGAFATSYIPTVASQVTRAADNAVMTGTNFSSWYNAAEGTAYCSFLRFSNNSAPYPIGFSGGSSPTAVPRISMRTDAAVNIQTQGLTSGSVTSWSTANFANSSGVNAVNNAVIAFSSSFAGGCVNGGAVTSVTPSAGVPTGIDKLFIGAQGQMNGYIRRIAFYSIRLSNAQLQGITA